MSADVEKVAAFIADLDALTEKHGIAIEGCGCCMSPYLVKAGTDSCIGFGDLTQYASDRYSVYRDSDYAKVTRDGVVDDV
jgi:hypothetical protein